MIMFIGIEFKMATHGTGALTLIGMEGAGNQQLTMTNVKRNTSVKKNERVKVL